MYFPSHFRDEGDNATYRPRRRRLRRESEGDPLIFDPFRHHFPMHISEILKRFRNPGDMDDTDNGRESHLSMPSSSATRRSFVINSPRPSAGLSRCGTGKSGRPRWPMEVDIKSQEQWDDMMSKEGLVVVDAYSGWCGPCKAIESTFRRIRNETGDDLLHFAMAETDKIETLAAYREKSRPTFLFYGGGQLVNVIRGCDAPQLIRSIAHHLKEEHQIIDGQADRKVFVDAEVQQQQQQQVEEKGDEQKTSEVDFYDDDDMGIFGKFGKAGEEVVEVPKEISVAIIKPDAVESGHAEEIIRNIEASGVEILHKEEKILSKEEAAEFYKQHEGSEHFEELIEYMSSGPVLTLVLSKRGEEAGYGLIPEIRDLIGPTDVNLAKEEAPESIRAQYGTDSIKNAVHACDSAESAARELAFFFPNFNVPTVHEKRKRKQIQRTLALIRPGAYAHRKASILRQVEEAGFTIAMSKEMQLSREQAEEFYEDHKGKDYFDSLINNMTSGPSLALCLAREDAVETWRGMLGPKEVAVAKEEAPESLRAVFAEDDDPINPLHGADSKEAAEKEIHALFPPQSTVAVIKPDAYGEIEQREQILKKIKHAGFKISAQKEISLTKELASQFYGEHEGKDFFNGLTDYMSSGPTLFMILSREDAVAGFRALAGPTELDAAKEEAPNSLRAMFAKDTMKNAVHSSSNVEKATAVIHEFFPEVELNPDGTVKEPEPLADIPEDPEGGEAVEGTDAAAANEDGTAATGAAEAGEGEVGTTEAGEGEAGTAEAGEGEAGTTEVGEGEKGAAEASKGEAGPTEAGHGETGAAETEQGDSSATETGEGEAGTAEAEKGQETQGDAGATADAEPKTEDAVNEGADKPSEETKELESQPAEDAEEKTADSVEVNNNEVTQEKVEENQDAGNENEAKGETQETSGTEETPANEAGENDVPTEQTENANAESSEGEVKKEGEVSNNNETAEATNESSEANNEPSEVNNAASNDQEGTTAEAKAEDGEAAPTENDATADGQTVEKEIEGEKAAEGEKDT